MASIPNKWIPKDLKKSEVIKKSDKPSAKKHDSIAPITRSNMVKTLRGTRK